MTRVLILGGTTEASALARALEGDDRFAATLSLAGVTRTPLLPALPVRIGGFGGADGLRRWLQDARTDALVDATHPFAHQITRNAAAAAAAAGIAMLRIARPPWEPVAGDRWTTVPDLEAAAASLGIRPARVLLTVGRKDLGPFLLHPQHRYLVRSVDPPSPDALPPDSLVLAERGPFALPDERALLLAHRIEVVVTRNSGGTAVAAKLAAAREAGLRVVMVARAPPQPGPSVATWPQALLWLERLHRGLGTLRAV